MIFVSTGTVTISFARLIDAAIEIAKAVSPEQVIIQGSTCSIHGVLPQNASLRDLYTYQETCDLYRQADVVITAGGEASILSALPLVKHPLIIVPRQKRYGEHVDNQQMDISHYYASHFLCYCVDDIRVLSKTIEKVLYAGSQRRRQSPRADMVKKLVSNLSSYLDNVKKI